MRSVFKRFEIEAAIDFAGFKAVSKSVPYEIVVRRPGDVAQCYADPRYAYEVLGWKAELGIERMCEEAWRWQSMNPKGYK